MADRARSKLTDRQVRGHKLGRLADGGGLTFDVRAPGALGIWTLRIRVNGGKQREFGLGTIRDTTLAQARAKAEAIRTNLANGLGPKGEDADPSKSAPSKTAPSFSQEFEALMTTLAGSWRNEKHVAQWRSTIMTHAAPLLPMPVDQITVEDIVGVLSPIWLVIPETASRLRGRIQRVLDAAIVLGHRAAPNPAAWTGNLQLLMPRQKASARGHFRALPIQDAPKLVAAIRSVRSVSVSGHALLFLLATAARSGEVLGAIWSEIDLDQKLWTIPGERMKGGRVHQVPLNSGAMAILHEMQRLRPAGCNGASPVFPGQKRGTHLSTMALEMCLRRSGLNESTTPHGLRSTFRDWVGEMTDFPSELAEMSLAHVVANRVERAYRRGTALERRRELMDAWGAFCGL